MSNTAAFSAISNFTTSLSEIFGETYRPLKLYCHIISKTKPIHENPIQKHIDAFKKFCVENREAILNKDYNSLTENKIEYSGKAQIDIREILKSSDTEIRDVIWQHILIISAILDPENNAKKALQEDQAKSKDETNSVQSGAENNFLSGLMSKVEKHAETSDNPMEVVGSIFKSNEFGEIIQNMTQGLSEGSLDMGKMLGEVGNMVNQVKVDEDDTQGGDAMKMVNTMLSGLTNPGQQGENQPDMAGMMTNLLGSMMGGGGGGGMPDLSAMMGGGGGGGIDDRINAQVEQAKKKGSF